MKQKRSFFRSLLCTLLSVCLLCLLGGCSKQDSVELAEGVEFKLSDVLKVQNTTSNSVYYYFLASIENHSDATYHVSNLDYRISNSSGTSTQLINPIDQFKSTITNDLTAGTSTYVYGYIGFPNNSQKNLGLYFPSTDAFLPFDSTRVRTIKDSNITNSDQAKFVIYEDEYFEFEVDAENVEYAYKNGISVVCGLKITYKNKTDQRLVVPYLTPICTIDGLKISDYGTDKLKAMSLDELKKQDYKKNGMAPKTQSYTGEALGYELFYLAPNQSVDCDIRFRFKGIIPDFSDSATSRITININSAPLGYSQIIKVAV